MAGAPTEDGGHASSGAWKLALADFMISLMCVFLTLWILQYLDKQDQQKLVELLAPETDSAPEVMILPGSNSVSAVSLDYIARSKHDSDLRRIDDTSLIEGEVNSQQQLEVLAKKVKEQLEQADKDGAVDVQVTPQGLKLTLSDGSEGPMFASGRTDITPYYQDLLLSLAPTLGVLKNKMVIAGHTDASRYIGSDRTNWDLSSMRANKARYYLQRGGVSRRSFFQVIGFGDSALLNQEEPRNSENRRIEIVVLTRDAEERLKTVYHHQDFQGGEVDESSLNDLRTDASGTAKENAPVTEFEVLKEMANGPQV